MTIYLDHNTSLDPPKLPSHGYGLTVPPWETELGEEVVYQENGHFSIAAVEQTRLNETVADFYLLDGLSNHVIIETPTIPPQPIETGVMEAMIGLVGDVPPGDEKTVEGFIGRAAHKYATLLHQFTPVLLHYMTYAISSELHYHKASRRILGVSAAAGWDAMIRKFGLSRCSKWASAMFRDTGWSESYGGESWAKGTDICMWYADGMVQGMPFGAKEFCDRAFSLQHNTGSYLNKLSWKDGMPDTTLKKLLDAHHQSKWDALLKRASVTVVELFSEYTDLCNEVRKAAGLDEVYPADKSTEGKVADMAKVSAAAKKKKSSKPPTPKLPAKKIMLSKFPGKCKTSGQVFPVGTKIVWHGPQQGASIFDQYMAETSELIEDWVERIALMKKDDGTEWTANDLTTGFTFYGKGIYCDDVPFVATGYLTVEDPEYSLGPYIYLSGTWKRSWEHVEDSLHTQYTSHTERHDRWWVPTQQILDHLNGKAT